MTGSTRPPRPSPLGNRAARVFLALGLVAGPAAAQTYRTPRAGEAYTAVVLGAAVTAPARRRDSVTAINLGLSALPSGPEERHLVPFGALFLWRNRATDSGRLRGVLSGLYDDVRYNRASSVVGGSDAVFTFQNTYLPFGRSEYVEGRRIGLEELTRHEFHAGAGIGYRRHIGPGHQDNAVEGALTYEPGLLLFSRGDDTDPGFILPRNTYEGRVHLRFRLDAVERNILELPHEGLAFGLDAVSGHRSRWSDWGGTVFGAQAASSGKSWTAVSGYALVAGPLPFSRLDRHRLIASAYAGTGSHLDRFSAFRLGGGSNAGDWEALSQPILDAAAVDEFFPRHYVVVSVEYRYEIFFFLYVRLRGSLAQVERPRFSTAGSVEFRTQPMDSVLLGLTSGFLWNSEVELSLAHNFGVLRQRDGHSRRGGDAVLFSVSKEF